MHAIYIISIKAFGDFVIALNALKRTSLSCDEHASIIVAGEHLRPLVYALNAEQKVFFIGDKSWLDVPAAFDAGKRGKWAALRSLLALRSNIGALGNDRTLVFDHIGWRESFISLGQPCLGLPLDSHNIYLAYANLLASLGYKGYPPAMPHTSSTMPKRAVLVPGSRIGRKQVPPQVSFAINRELEKRGIELTAIRLEGEDVDIPASLETQVLPRNFSALCTSLRDADLVISADSLSAHLGEYFEIPTFVLTPTPNTYWLPSTAFRDSAWANFDSLSPFCAWIEKQCQTSTRIATL